MHLEFWTPIRGEVNTFGDHLMKFVDGYAHIALAEFEDEYPTEYVAIIKQGNQVVYKEVPGRPYTMTNCALVYLVALTYLTIVIPIAMFALKVLLRSIRNYEVLNNGRTDAEQKDLESATTKSFGKPIPSPKLERILPRQDRYRLVGTDYMAILVKRKGYAVSLLNNLQKQDNKPFMFLHNNLWFVATKEGTLCAY